MNIFSPHVRPGLKTTFGPYPNDRARKFFEPEPFLCRPTSTPMTSHTTQLDPPILVTTEHGEGYAMLYTDYGPLENACWTIARKSDGQLRHYNTAQVKLSTNYTYGINTKEEKKK